MYIVHNRLLPEKWEVLIFRVEIRISTANQGATPHHPQWNAVLEHHSQPGRYSTNAVTDNRDNRRTLQRTSRLDPKGKRKV